METLRFLMISTHYPPHHLGGDAVLVDYLSKELAVNGHEVHVAYNPSIHGIIRQGSEERRRAVDASGITRHQISTGNPRLSLFTALSLGYSPTIRREINELLRRVNPDVVHWHNTKGFISPPLDTPKSVSLYTAHDYYAICPRSNLLKPDASICVSPRRCHASQRLS